LDIDHGAAAAAPARPAAVADPRQLRTMFAGFATGVTVVTVGGDSPHGMTANAFASVSLDPPLVLVCIDHDARMHQALRRADAFAISVLAEHQEQVARHFASRHRPHGRAQFAAVDWSPGNRTGAPLIDGALAWFECTVWCVYDGGDHSIFLGRLISADRRDHDDPLVFFDGRFRQFRQLGQEVLR
jgi:flavin reductase (DIM6/NTAB) family NADH-FMN oxidoreductase RutF